jgi:chitin-binding protein
MRTRTTSGSVARRRGFLALVIAAMTCLFVWTPTASAHGTIVDPATAGRRGAATT